MCDHDDAYSSLESCQYVSSAMVWLPKTQHYVIYRHANMNDDCGKTFYLSLEMSEQQTVYQPSNVHAFITFSYVSRVFF